MKKLAVVILFLTIATACFANEKMQKKEKGQIHLSAQAVTSIVTANEYIPVSGNFVDGNIKNFTLDSNGTLTYIGYGNDVLFSGVSDVAVNKNCKITYALFRNGVLIPEAQTPHNFQGVSITETLAITHILYVNHGDAFQVYCKSDQVNTDLTVDNLCVTFWGR